MQDSAGLKIVDGSEISGAVVGGINTTTGGFTSNMMPGAGQNCGYSSAGCISYMNRSYYPYQYPTVTADVSIRFVENGCLVSFAGKEYIFKDIVAAAAHITKLRAPK